MYYYLLKHIGNAPYMSGLINIILMIRKTAVDAWDTGTNRTDKVTVLTEFIPQGVMINKINK